MNNQNQTGTISIGECGTVSDYQDPSIDVTIKCECDPSIDVNSLSCNNHSVTVAPTLNPYTNSQHHSFINPLGNTTVFERDCFYDDRFSYFLTSSTIRDFSQTFSDSSLQGIQLVKACVAFSLRELGYVVCIDINSEELILKHFCEKQRLNYIIV